MHACHKSAKVMAVTSINVPLCEREKPISKWDVIAQLYHVLQDKYSSHTRHRTGTL